MVINRFGGKTNIMKHSLFVKKEIFENEFLKKIPIKPEHRENYHPGDELTIVCCKQKRQFIIRSVRRDYMKVREIF